MAEAADFYNRAFTRIVRFAIALGILGTIYTFATRGNRLAMGFVVGAGISVFNFYGLRWLVDALAGSGQATSAVSTLFFGLRYFMAGGVVYVIVRVLDISLMSVLAGLFVAAAAVMIEIVYELVSQK